MIKTNMIKRGLSALALAMLSTILCVPSVFAENIYGMDYSGGVALSSDNVRIEPEMLNSLTPLITRNNINAVEIPADSSLQRGYYTDSNSSCHEFYYFTVGDQKKAAAPKYYYTVSSDKYIAVVRIENIVYESNRSETNAQSLTAGADDESSIVAGVHGTNRYVYISAGTAVYSDATCSTRVPGTRSIVRGEERVFIEVNVKLYNKADLSPFTSRGLYISITDIDAGQSYKILNKLDQLTAGKMYAKSADNLQPSEEKSGGNRDIPVTLRNMFVGDGNYIYSEYNEDQIIATDENNNIFARLSSETQEEGLNFVFGFASAAGSGIEYYADFAEDEVPATDEAEPMAVPNTGSVTEEDSNATLTMTSIIGVLAIALMIYASPRLFHKKIDFKK